jgi:biopolymer transport protein ExbD
MARRRHYEPEPPDEPATDIASLIDCSFLLLIYFLVTSTMTPPEADLGLTLPSSAGTSAVKLEPIVLRIDQQGTIYNGTTAIETDATRRKLPVLLEELSRLKQAASITGSEPVVTVSADDAAPNQRFIDVVNALSQTGITNITLSGFRQ